MPFFQSAPALGNQFTSDRVLRSYLLRTLPPDVIILVNEMLGFVEAPTTNNRTALRK